MAQPPRRPLRRPRPALPYLAAAARPPALIPRRHRRAAAAAGARRHRAPLRPGARRTGGDRAKQRIASPPRAGGAPAAAERPRRCGPEWRRSAPRPHWPRPPQCPGPHRADRVAGRATRRSLGFVPAGPRPRTAPAPPTTRGAGRTHPRAPVCGSGAAPPDPAAQKAATPKFAPSAAARGGKAERESVGFCLCPSRSHNPAPSGAGCGCCTVQEVHLWNG